MEEVILTNISIYGGLFDPDLDRFLDGHGDCQAGMVWLCQDHQGIHLNQGQPATLNRNIAKYNLPHILGGV